MLGFHPAFHEQKQISHVSTEHIGVQGYNVLNLGTLLSACGEAGGAISRWLAATTGLWECSKVVQNA